MGWELLFMQGSPFLFSFLPQLGWILISFIICLDIFLIFSDNFISHRLEIPPHVILSRVEREQVVSGPGSSLSLACLVQGNPQPQLQWYFADAKVGDSSYFFQGIRQ